MPYYRAEPSRPDRAKAIGGVVAVYVLIGGLMLLAEGPDLQRMIEQAPTVLIDIKPPPPPPPPQEQTGKARREEGAAGRKAEPSPVVVPKPKIEVPAKSPVAASPIAGAGSASSAGASTAGSGPGAGGSGTGRGGGGTGLGSDARLLGGNSSRLPSRMLRGFAADRGYGFLLLTISEAGRVSDCSVLQSAGSADVDAALCNLMMRRSIWAPARDRQGNPVSVKVRYTATWAKN
jgi:protein TonB